jgi:glycosyltransferase involved in cell wall biosynthesis
MTVQPLISVIMPCYNAASYVEEAGRCVMGQGYPNVELMVVDDGSTDGSAEIVRGLAEEFRGRIRQPFQDHAGPYPARNHGLRYAKGELVAFLDAEDWWSPCFLEKLHAALAEHPDAALAKRKFVRDHPEQVRHLDQARVRELVDGGMLRRSYDNFWRRDLVSARRIFRMSLISGGWQPKDLKYLLPALLPEPLYLWLVGQRDK